MSNRVRIGEIEVQGENPLSECVKMALQIFHDTGNKMPIANASLGFGNTEVAFTDQRDIGMPPPNTPGIPEMEGLGE